MPQFAEFINRYENALNEHDVATFADCHSSRFMHMSRRHDGWRHAWRKNDDEYQQQALKALRFYQQLGAAAFRAVGVRRSHNQPAHSLCRVGWRVERPDGSELVKLETTYMVRVRDGQAKIVAFIDHDEHERLAERCLLPATRPPLLFGLAPEHQGTAARRPSQSGKIGFDALLEDLMERTG